MVANIQMEFLEDLKKQKAFFKSGATRSYKFRKKSLEALYQSIKKYESEIIEAIRLDMGRNSFDAFGGDVGVIYKEISSVKKNLRRWMKREKRPTPLSLFPGRSFIIREPLGQVLIIAPWNYPSNLSFIPLVQAIAAGNCAVVKPSEISCHTEKIILKIIRETFTPEYVMAISGAGAEVIPPLMDAIRFDHIFYTGSGHVGKSIAQAAAEKLIPVTLELGGKSPALVDRSANLKLAARKIIWGKFFNTGQTCVAPDYVLVPKEQYQNFVSLCKEQILEFYGPDPILSPDYGRIISDNHFQRLNNLLTEGTILHGGKANAKERYIAPTLVGNLDAHDRLMKEEIFGPILPIIPYENLEAAFDIIEENPYPLAFYFFGRNKDTRNLSLREVQFGGGIINHSLLHFVNNDLPFGGVGWSGYGKYHGKEGLDLFSNKKPVMIFPNWFDHPLFYPPFSKKIKEKIARLFLR
jgi:aldehyde dehydrogenase (NAD+)